MFHAQFLLVTAPYVLEGKSQQPAADKLQLMMPRSGNRWKNWNFFYVIYVFMLYIILYCMLCSSLFIVFFVCVHAALYQQLLLTAKR